MTELILHIALESYTINWSFDSNYTNGPDGGIYFTSGTWPTGFYGNDFSRNPLPDVSYSQYLPELQNSFSVPGIYQTDESGEPYGNVLGWHTVIREDQTTTATYSSVYYSNDSSTAHIDYTSYLERPVVSYEILQEGTLPLGLQSDSDFIYQTGAHNTTVTYSDGRTTNSSYDSASYAFLSQYDYVISIPELPPFLFTSGIDKVNFNSLTATQIDAIAAGADLYKALSGNDVVVLPDQSAIIPVSWDEQVTFSAGDGADTVTGGNRNDKINGDSGDDTISGGAGNDTIHGDEGDDIIYGIDNVALGATEDGENAITGGSGVDTVRWSGDFEGYTKKFTVTLDSILRGEGEFFKFKIESINGSDILSDRMEHYEFAGREVSEEQIRAGAGFKWELDSLDNLVKLLALIDELGDGEGLDGPIGVAWEWYFGIKGIVDKAITAGTSPNVWKATFVESNVLLVDALELYVNTQAPGVAIFTEPLFDDLRDLVRAEAGTTYDIIMHSTLPISERMGEYWGDLWTNATNDLPPQRIEAPDTEPFVPNIPWQEPPAPHPLPTNDIDGDGDSDIIIHSEFSNQLGALKLEGASLVFSAIGTGGTGWKAIGSGDVTGDGTADVIWHSPSTNAIGVYAMDSGSASWMALGRGGAGWTLAGTGDLTADGTSDLLWLNPTSNAFGMFRMDSGHAEWASVGRAGSGWTIAGIGDFTGDGTKDILWKNAATNNVDFHTMDDGSATWVAVGKGGTGWSVAGTGDFTGDGVEDILWQRARRMRSGCR